MPCPDHESLSAFADRGLDASEAAIIERHLAGCAACREVVEEMARLDACGRSAFRAIHVPARSSAIIVLETANRRRWLALAAAAVVFVTVSELIWFFAYRPQPARIPQRQSAAAAEAAFSDEAFERWAEPYRRLKIPLVPLEEVAKHEFREQEITRSSE